MNNNSNNIHQKDNGNNLHLESAKKIMTSKIPVISKDLSIKDVKKILSKNSKEYEVISYLYVVNQKNILVGVISIKDIFFYSERTKIKKIMNKKIISVRANTDQERAVIIALKYNLKAVPVVDKENRLLGVITPNKIIETLNKEGIEDILHSEGIGKFKNPLFEIIYASPLTHFKKRIPWLMIGLIGGILAASIVGLFENILQIYVILIAFIPAVVYLADAVGAQSQTIFIRSLALDKKLDFKRYFVREIKVNFLLGIVLGSLFYLIILIFWKAPFFALILGISIFITVLISMLISIFIPLAFNKMNFDPAISSGPFGTVIRDLISLFLYFFVSHSLISIFLI